MKPGNNSKRWGLIAVIILAPQVASLVCADVTGDIELLPGVADQVSKNESQIRTWRGTMEITTKWRKSPDPKTLVDTRKTAEFILDREQNALRNWTALQGPHRFTDVSKSGEKTPRTIVEPLIISRMIKDTTYYRLDPFVSGDKAERRVLSLFDRSHWNPKKDDLSIDPMGYLHDECAAAANAFRVWYKIRDQLAAGNGKIDIQHEGTLILVNVELRGVENRYAVDLAQGGNLVSMFTTDDSGTEWRTEITYENKNGVFVPRKISKLKETGAIGDQRGDKRLLFETIVSWTGSVVNEPVTPDEFTLKALGMRKGDLVADERDGTRYQFRGEEK